MFTRLVSEHALVALLPGSDAAAWAICASTRSATPESIELYRRAAPGGRRRPDRASRSTRPAGRTSARTTTPKPPGRSARCWISTAPIAGPRSRPTSRVRPRPTWSSSLAAPAGRPRSRATSAGSVTQPYEQRILMSLGQHFRRFGQYDQAVATDQLCLQRYPDSPEALLAAQRMIDTHHARAAAGSRPRGAALVLGPLRPGQRLGAGAELRTRCAPPAPSSRASSLRTVAQEYHQRARSTHAPADWRAALDLYQQVLKSWPDDPDAPALALKAGEAATQLGEYSTALEHYQRAAAGSEQRRGPGDVAAGGGDRRMVREHARSGEPRQATRRDRPGLAGARGAAHRRRARARFPGHPHAADLLWREGNLAFAHGWLDESAARFGELASSHPGDARAARARSCAPTRCSGSVATTRPARPTNRR